MVVRRFELYLEHLVMFCQHLGDCTNKIPRRFVANTNLVVGAHHS